MLCMFYDGMHVLSWLALQEKRTAGSGCLQWALWHRARERNLRGGLIVCVPLPLDRGRPIQRESLNIDSRIHICVLTTVHHISSFYTHFVTCCTHPHPCFLQRATGFINVHLMHVDRLLRPRD